MMKRRLLEFDAGYCYFSGRTRKNIISRSCLTFVDTGLVVTFTVHRRLFTMVSVLSWVNTLSAWRKEWLTAIAFIHWNGNDVILIDFSSLGATDIVFGNRMSLWWYFPHCMVVAPEVLCMISSNDISVLVFEIFMSVHVLTIPLKLCILIIYKISAGMGIAIE